MPTDTLKEPKTAKAITAGLRPGDMVYWHPAGEIRNGKLPAMIISIRSDTGLCLRIFGENGDDTQDAVKHASDPGLTQMHRARVGSWTRREA